jgi:hypothetical protein
LAALAELFLYRITSAIFLPSQDGTAAERWLATLALFASHFAGILALALAVAALLSALGGDGIFPRSMRITVSTIGLFFCALAGIGVLWTLAPQYNVHLRISHAFLTMFLALGLFHSRRPWREKLGIMLFALPILIQAFIVFTLRMGWVQSGPGPIARVAHLMTLVAMIVAPLLLTRGPWSKLRVVLAAATGLLLAAGLASALVKRFDLVQAALFYGLSIDLGGLASTTEQIYSAALVAAFASLGAGIAGSLAGSAKSRLAGWGLLLMAVAGAEITSPKPALFTLCGLLALVVSGTGQPALFTLCGLLALVVSGTGQTSAVATADTTPWPPPAAPSTQA